MITEKVIKHMKFFKNAVVIQVTSYVLLSLTFFGAAIAAKPHTKTCDLSQPQATYHNCVGMVEYTDGSFYLGRFMNGLQDGQGQKTLSDGTSYIGEFVAGKMNGQGTLTNPDGMIDEGSFSNGGLNGKGKRTMPDGEKYIGDFERYNYNGKGIYYFKDGRRYEGYFKDGEIHGVGKLFNAAGKIEMQGNFDNGKFIGSESAKPPTAPQQKFNFLEKALNPFGGSKAMLSDFNEEGGLTRLNSWYGVNLTSYSTSLDDANNVRRIVVSAYSGTPLRQLRDIANSMCGFANEEWKKSEFDQGRRMTGQAENDKCFAMYDNFVNGVGVISLEIRRK